MNRPQNPNLALLERMVSLLGSLSEQMVFVGGCATGLLITDSAAPPVRVTRDVDAIVEVAALTDYHRLSADLRERGFREDQAPDAPICRWIQEELVLDVMPSDPEVLGFGNRWYRSAIEHAVTCALANGMAIRHVDGPHFLATKLAAFHGRGQSDPVLSHDLEDLIAVLDGRDTIVDEVGAALPALRQHLAKAFGALLRDEDFRTAVPGHLPGDAASQARLPGLLQRIQAIAEMT